MLDADGDGVADSSTIFVHDDGQIALDFAHTGPGDAAAADLAHRYLWGPAVDQLLGQETVDDGGSEDVLWALTDHLNSVRDLAQYDEATDTTAIARHLVYDAFGNVTSDTAAAVPSLFLYTARPYDADTGLQNNLHRWYDAVVGRWLSEDPIGFEAGDGNLYRYVGNGPLGATDPYGLLRKGMSTATAIERINLLMYYNMASYVVLPQHVIVSAKHNPEQGTGGKDYWHPVTSATQISDAASKQLKEYQQADSSFDPGCPCVGTLEIKGHGNHGFLVLQDGSPPTTIDASNAHAIGATWKKNIEFCPECVIVLTSCNAGNKLTSSFALALAQGSGCKVLAAGGFAETMTQKP